MSKGLGTGDNGAFTFLDLIAIIGAITGLMNLDINITQEDMDQATNNLEKNVNAEIKAALSEIHSHLESQDEKIDSILERLEVKA